MAEILSLEIKPPYKDDQNWFVNALDNRVLAYGEGATLIEALRSFVDDLEARQDTGERLEDTLRHLSLFQKNADWCALYGLPPDPQEWLELFED